MGIDPIEIARGVRARDRASIAAALNLVEDRRASVRDDRRALAKALADAPRGRVIGVTGPPGAGKSTLCASLAGRYLDEAGVRVGVVAIDPSSARSGGALLGDRARIVRDPPDPRLFVRSLAAAGELGGLSRTAPACIDLLAVASDVVLVETVGVGQSEIAIERVADVIVVVVQPASGDTLQFFKGGVLEIPDVLVVGKGDLGELARRTEADLRHAVASSRQAGIGADLAIVRVSATTGEGVDDLRAAIDARFSALESTDALAARRREGAVARVLTAIERRFGEHGIRSLGGLEALRARVRADLDAGIPIFEIEESLVDSALAART